MHYFLSILVISSFYLPLKASTHKVYERDVVNLLNLVHGCGAKFQAAMDKGAYVNFVEYYAPRPANELIRTEWYTITTATGGFIPGPPAQRRAKLTIHRTIDSSGPVIPDKPPQITTTCRLEYLTSNSKD